VVEQLNQAPVRFERIRNGTGKGFDILPFGRVYPRAVPHRRSDFPDKKIETLNFPPFPNEILETVKAQSG